MEQKALHTVKDRAEGKTDSAFVTLLEIIVWFVALALCLIAFVLFVNREGWNFLELEAMSVVVLLMLTFLFPPLWLRLLLDLSLLAGVISMLRGPVPSVQLQHTQEAVH
jgi:hypothetical protein